MKKIIVFLFFFLFFLSQTKSYSQNQDYCGMTAQSYYGQTPFKPPITGEYEFKILIVYVMFNNENFDSNNQVWPSNTTNGPSYFGQMLAQSANHTSQWWNAYNTETQSISSWFCEVSRGQIHVIGEEKFVKLDFPYTYYRNFSNPEDVINREIYDKLTNQNVTWSDYDNWKYNYNTGAITYEKDHKLDMIYKIHRYKYYEENQRELLPEGAASGFAYLGKASNTSNSYDYEISQGNQIWHILGGFPDYISGETDGSGVTVVGNGTSGIISKQGVLGRVTHEHGHWFFGAVHYNYCHMGPNDASDYSFSPWEKINLDYITPYTPSFTGGYEEVVLDDFSGRTTNGKYIIKVPLVDGSYYLIVNRSKVSHWDRVMLGDTAKGDPESVNNYGAGVYIYHIYNDYYMDMECADGLWQWQHNGYDIPDWETLPKLPVLLKTNPVRNTNDNGNPVCVDNYPYTVKDGRDIQGLSNPNYGNVASIFKYFSIGEKELQQYGIGKDRFYSNKSENWTSREYQGDRWDAWRMDYNEMFSPYSCPGTTNWSNANSSGTFIRIYDYNSSTKQYTIRIYRDGNIYQGGMDESDILDATPPSKPVGIKHIFYYPPNQWCVPEIVWEHNTELDMLREDDIKRYQVFRVTASDMSTLPDENSYTQIATVDIKSTETPHYIDYSILEYDCAELDQIPPFGTQFPVRYRVKAVDNTDNVSVFSDFASTTGITQDGDRQLINGNNSPISQENIPKKHELYQNFPNPFNPVTKINFDLPKDSRVSLVIYDILGKEISKLINGEFKTAGRYMIDFNGSNLPSGVYFYRLTAGNYVSVKRMVLIK